MYAELGGSDGAMHKFKSGTEIGYSDGAMHKIKLIEVGGSDGANHIVWRNTDLIRYTATVTGLASGGLNADGSLNGSLATKQAGSNPVVAFYASLPDTKTVAAGDVLLSVPVVNVWSSTGDSSRKLSFWLSPSPDKVIIDWAISSESYFYTRDNGGSTTGVISLTAKSAMSFKDFALIMDYTLPSSIQNSVAWDAGGMYVCGQQINVVDGG